MNFSRSLSHILTSVKNHLDGSRFDFIINWVNAGVVGFIPSLDVEGFGK